jgi:N-acetylmuramoyl-L-alanine amidase
MKKIVIGLVCLLLLPSASSGAMQFLKLRSSHHPGFLRMVMEGSESVISKALVYQRGKNIIVNFPDVDFSINSENESLVYSKVDKYTVMFYPGEFRGLKVFTLKHPTRLVMDVYLKEDKQYRAPVIPAPEEKDKVFAVKIRTVVIDPGHGGYEYGIVKDKYIEKNVLLDIAQKLNILINRGSSVSFLTRGSDRLLTQDEKIEFIKQKEADIFISLHVGNHSNIVVYVPMITEQVPEDIKPYLDNTGQEDYMNETISLLNAMQEALIADFGEGTVSVRPLPYSILSKVEAAALMIELPSFEGAHYIEKLRTKIANTLYKGLYFYEEIKEK